MTPTVEIRPADVSSAEELIALVMERIPRMRRQQAEFLFQHHDDLEFLQLRTAHVGDELAGWGFALRPPPFPPELGIVKVIVRRSHERRGIGSALYRELVGTLPAHITRLALAVDDSDAESLAIARAHGYEVTQHGIESELDLVDLPEPPPLPGVTYEDVSDLRFPDEEAVDAMLVDSQTNPEATEQGIVGTLGTERQLLARCETPIAVLARVEGAPAAIITGEVADGVLSISYTGVGRTFRGRNLAFALKQHAHRVAAAKGATVCITTNEEQNLGIRHVNRKLGYRVVGGEYRLMRERP